nr:hypothetical protein Iba_chr03bCG2970 [Ipomoea batatas]
MAADDTAKHKARSELVLAIKRRHSYIEIQGKVYVLMCVPFLVKFYGNRWVSSSCRAISERLSVKPPAWLSRHANLTSPLEAASSTAASSYGNISIRISFIFTGIKAQMSWKRMGEECWVNQGGNFHSPVELSNEMNCAPCLFVFSCKFSRDFLDESSIFCFKDLSFSNRVTSAGLLSPIPTAGLELSSS